MASPKPAGPGGSNPGGASGEGDQKFDVFYKDVSGVGVAPAACVAGGAAGVGRAAGRAGQLLPGTAWPPAACQGSVSTWGAGQGVWGLPGRTPAWQGAVAGKGPPALPASTLLKGAMWTVTQEAVSLYPSGRPGSSSVFRCRGPSITLCAENCCQCCENRNKYLRALKHISSDPI